MKVVISIPAEVFSEGEALARRFGISRSGLYRRALEEFISCNAEAPVTRAMNEAIDAIGAVPDEFSVAASRRALSKVDWGSNL
jgi:hypothetical protein